MTKTRSSYRKNQLPSLTLEQIDKLLTAFSNADRQLKCPICHNLSGFTKHEYQTQDPTQKWVLAPNRSPNLLQVSSNLNLVTHVIH